MLNKISIIIPCLNEEENILETLLPLQKSRQRGHEIILCDGGSTDSTITLSTPYVDKIITSNKGRAIQMNNGAASATGNIFCFLHADTIATENIDSLIISALHSNKLWGRFNIRLNNNKWPFRIIESLINIRSCISGIASGDQGIFIHSSVFNKLDGFKNQPLMEDIELSKRLKKITRPACIKDTLITSSRRWEKHGIIQTVILMWTLRLKYFLGTPVEKLHTRYRRHDK